ncbi:MAG: ABC transporter permease [Pseudomonadota bacterium]
MSDGAIARPKRGASVLSGVWRFMKGSPLNFASVVIIVTAILIAAVATLGHQLDIQVTPWDPYAPNLQSRMEAPSLLHPLGTDHLGRDTFSRVVEGSRVTLQVALLVLAVASLVGLTAGVVAGYFGGLVDEILMRLTDLFLAFPFIILAAAISIALGGNIATTTIALATVFWPWYARLARGVVMEARELDFVKAAEALGATRTRMMVRTLLPVVLPYTLVQMTLDAGFVMLSAAGLAFLGLGAAPPTPEWGTMIFDALTYQPDAWWLIAGPGGALAITALGFNLMGDGLRDWLDPRSGGAAMSDTAG